MKTGLLLVAFLACGAGCSASGFTGSVREGTGDYVVLLHGMGRTHRSMRKMEKNLSEAGYRVLNLDYPSWRTPLADVSKLLHRTLESQCTNDSRKIHFVTHSYGGIVVRQYAQQHPSPRLGRVVMLAPPNQGSELVEDAKGTFLTKLVVPPTARALGTAANDVPRSLGRVGFELGVIAGDRSWNPLFSLLIPGPDDGQIAVKDARAPGTTDFLRVHATHTFMMRNETVIRHALHFLERGRF